MLGVLTCHQRFSGVLDLQIAAYIIDAGLDGLLRVLDIDLNHALITMLVERWQPEMHSFHLPHGEMTIILQDMEVIMGVPVDGLLVVGFTHMDNWGNLCADLLGHRPPGRDVGASENTAVLCGARLRASWLESWFSNPLSASTIGLLMQ